VRLSVVDRGVGLRAGEAERLFQAFYTTKPHGMGLGLAISRSIIESHGGRLWAEPNSGPGATFSFRLPASATPPRGERAFRACGAIGQDPTRPVRDDR
jgi:signal transduction histidine kinase